MKKDIFDYSVDEIYEYVLNLYEHRDTGNTSNMILAAFALVFYASLPSLIAKENTKELFPIANYITKENIEKILAILLEIRKAYNSEERDSRQ